MLAFVVRRTARNSLLGSRPARKSLGSTDMKELYLWEGQATSQFRAQGSAHTRPRLLMEKCQDPGNPGPRAAMLGGDLQHTSGRSAHISLRTAGFVAYGRGAQDESNQNMLATRTMGSNRLIDLWEAVPRAHMQGTEWRLIGVWGQRAGSAGSNLHHLVEIRMAISGTRSGLRMNRWV